MLHICTKLVEKNFRFRQKRACFKLLLIRVGNSFINYHYWGVNFGIKQNNITYGLRPLIMGFTTCNYKVSLSVDRATLMVSVIANICLYLVIYYQSVCLSSFSKKVSPPINFENVICVSFKTIIMYL